MQRASSLAIPSVCQSSSVPDCLALDTDLVQLRCPTSACIFLGLVDYRLPALERGSVHPSTIQTTDHEQTGPPAMPIRPGQWNHILWACGAAATAPIRMPSTHVPLPQCPHVSALRRSRRVVAKHSLRGPRKKWGQLFNMSLWMFFVQ